MHAYINIHTYVKLFCRWRTCE